MEADGEQPSHSSETVSSAPELDDHAITSLVRLVTAWFIARVNESARPERVTRVSEDPQEAQRVPQQAPELNPDDHASAPEPVTSAREGNAEATVSSSSWHQPGSQGGSGPDGYADGTGDVLPGGLLNPKPRYPPDAVAAGLEGTVLLLVTVGQDGTVNSVTVRQSSGVRSLDTAALTAVRRWRFVPGTKDGVAVQIAVLLPIRFSLSDN